MLKSEVLEDFARATLAHEHVAAEDGYRQKIANKVAMRVEAMKTFSVVAAICLVLASTVTNAGEGAGRIGLEHVGDWGVPYVYFYTTTHINPPACNSYRKRWVVDLTTQAGKSMYAYLLSAAASDAQIRVWGNNTCPGSGDSEQVQAVGTTSIVYTGTAADIPSF